MEGLLQPTHLVFIILIVGIFTLPKLIKFIWRNLSSGPPVSTSGHVGSSATASPDAATEMKYCADCGKQILRRAEICPHCGCRQLPLA
jgi:hypothetical protein